MNISVIRGSNLATMSKTQQIGQNRFPQNREIEKLQRQLQSINAQWTDGFVQPSWEQSLSFDTPKASDGKQFTYFTEETVSEKAQELASSMTETPVGVEFNLDGMSMEQLANLFGGIGRQIDDALAAGEISEQEYEDLNKGLSEYTAFMTEKEETRKAMWEVMRQTAKATQRKVESGASDEEMAVYAEKVKNSWQDKIREFLEDNSYDRTLLNEMIAIIRDGRSLPFDREA